jgi:acyl-CoA thioesterase FadM
MNLGLHIEDYTRLGFAFVACRHELNYLAPTFIDDRLIVGTGIVTFT